MNLNKVYEKVINSLIIPKYDFISGIEALKVTKDDIERVIIRVNFYLKASWAREMFNDDCRRKYIDGRGGSIILDFDDMYKCVLNKFKDEEIFLIDDLTTINKLLGYKANYFSGGAFDVRFVLDFKN